MSYLHVYKVFTISRVVNIAQSSFENRKMTWNLSLLCQFYILACNFALYIFSHFSQMHIFSKAIIYKSRGELSLLVQHKIVLTFGPAQSCNYFKKQAFETKEFV